MTDEERARQRADQIADRLDQLVEEIDEVSFDLLRGAAAEGRTARPAMDRTLTQARRAVARAAALLHGRADTDE